MKKLSLTLLSLCTLSASAMFKPSNLMTPMEMCRQRTEDQKNLEILRTRRIQDVVAMSKIANNLMSSSVGNKIARAEHERLLKLIISASQELFSNDQYKKDSDEYKQLSSLLSAVSRI
jgi:hypothetical protein